MREQFNETQLFEAFVTSAQYLARLKTQQDPWDHLGQLMTAHFPADWAAFARREPGGGITVHHVTPSEAGNAREILTDGVSTVIADVLDSGFLASRVIQVQPPEMVAFLPIVEEYKPREVMLIGHQSVEPLSKELLNVYLAVAGMAGSAVERLHNEHELNRHRDYLEELVKARTAELAKAQRQNELILGSVQEGICGLDPQGRITFVNPFAAQLLGWEAAELIGRDAHATFHHSRAEGCSNPAAECRVLATLKTGEAHNATDEEFVSKHGHAFPVEFVSAPVVEEGRTVGAVLAFRDITDRQQAELKMRQTMEELERSNKELEQFAYISSHDLQEPLRQVQAFAQLLRDRYKGKLDDKADQYILFVSDGAARMSDLVRGLLDYSRVGARESTRQATSCQQAIDTALANLQTSISEAQARVTHDELPTVTIEPTQLTQLFQNLIGNAIKFRRDGVPPEIHVSASREGSHWLLSVRDNGIGIAPQHQQKIFQIFQRLHTREKYQGTGIGLAICKKIVEQHGGRIWIESQVGQGSTFYFSLPLS